jgi:hypothetical protein
MTYKASMRIYALLTNLAGDADAREVRGYFEA